MNWRLISALFILLTGTTATTAQEAPVWTCAYPSYFGKRDPVIIKFTQVACQDRAPRRRAARLRPLPCSFRFAHAARAQARV
jgi:hypothetical protein